MNTIGPFHWKSVAVWWAEQSDVFQLNIKAGGTSNSGHSVERTTSLATMD